MIGRFVQHGVLARGLTALAILSVAGCGGAAATASPAAPAASVTPAPTLTITAPPNAEQVTFWSWVPDINKQVDAFNASHSDVFVNFVNNGNGNTEYAKLKTALQAGTDIPDVVQIEYQHLPGFISRGQVANIATLGASDAKSKFVPWTWSQVSQGAGVYGYPQDAGPMIMMCNKTLLAKFNLTPPKTWAEFATSAATIHKADKNVFLSNYTTDQGWYFGMLWQSGAKPFIVDGSNISINFTSAEATRVATYWGDLLKSGNLSPVATWSSDWNAALNKSQIACWQAGAWGPSAISGGAPDTKGQWEVDLLPQWTADGKTDGSYGGSAVAVTNASQHKKAADEFARWLTTDPKITLDLTGGTAVLFPVQLAAVADPAWTDGTDPFWSGQATHKVMAQAMAQVDPSFGWSPFTDFVYSAYADDLVKVMSAKMTMADLMKDLQTRSVQYAKDQGFTVK